ncbi:hypothetical protein NQZ68_020161 [Dissostichus eleginoides]|nr:hypothetical protein NQZ68_020161 [Dissostichus eleginoides]
MLDKGSGCQGWSKVCAGSTEWVKDVVEVDETNLRDSRRLPVRCFLVKTGVDWEVLQVFISAVSGDQLTLPQRITVRPHPLKMDLRSPKRLPKSLE